MIIHENKNTGKVAKIWVKRKSDIEEITLEQIDKMLELPHLFKHIAIMPDAHLGKGAVIGSVVATKDIIVPNIVGVDIGCGISAYQTEIVLDEKLNNRGFWQDWYYNVKAKIPLGFDSYCDKQSMRHLDKQLKAVELLKLLDGAGKQLGTLGGGNHFIEAQTDKDRHVWFMIHSGSRHIGFRIAKYYNDVAKDENIKNKEETPSNLWFLKLDSESGQNYHTDMSWAIDYALESRWRMLQHSVDSFFEKLNEPTKDVRKEGINIHHNFANLEKHFGENVIIHRKGATQAQYNQIGIIPGSMGTASYIVNGKGNPDSYESCSHGAGRVMSRKQAKKTISKEKLQKTMKETYTDVSMKFVDEAPEAYKDINKVVDNQKDLIEVLYKLKPIITLKG